MKIVEKGAQEHQKIARGFRCGLCGCAFEVEAREYQRVHIGRAVFLRTECPWCMHEVMLDETETETR